MVKINREDLTQEIVRELLDYDPETGKLFWKARDVKWFDDTQTRTAEWCCRLWNAKYAGKEAGTKPESSPYTMVYLTYTPFLAHRLVFLFFFGRFPEKHLDHIDGNKRNNKIENLREVDDGENRRNMPLQKNNISGCPGVRYVEKYDYWHARICVKRREVHLGYYSSFEEAVEVRKQAEIKYGFHKNHGRKQQNENQ